MRCWSKQFARQKVPRLDRRARLAVLLHDAPEYVIGDMISPFKAVIGDSYKAVEARLLAAIHLRFGLPAVPPESLRKLIKAADRSAAFFEATRLAGFEPPRRASSSAAPMPLSTALERDYLTPMAGCGRGEAVPRTVRIPCEGLTGHRNDHPLRYDYAMIHVCSLARLHDTVENLGARHIITLLKQHRPGGAPAGHHRAEPPAS